MSIGLATNGYLSSGVVTDTVNIRLIELSVVVKIKTVQTVVKVIA